MASQFENLSPPIRLSLVYCPAKLRVGFALLMRFDERIAEIALKQGEPMVVQLKLAWWRDALTMDAGKRPRGEPLLAELSQIEGEGHWPELAEAMRELLDAWGLLLANETWSDGVLRDYARQRGQAIFGAYLKWAGLPSRVATGERWALDDLAMRTGQPLPCSAPGEANLPRSLSILAMAAGQGHNPGGFSGIRLILHGLTGL